MGKLVSCFPCLSAFFSLSCRLCLCLFLSLSLLLSLSMSVRLCGCVSVSLRLSHHSIALRLSTSLYTFSLSLSLSLSVALSLHPSSPFPFPFPFLPSSSSLITLVSSPLAPPEPAPDEMLEDDAEFMAGVSAAAFAAGGGDSAKGGLGTLESTQQALAAAAEKLSSLERFTCGDEVDSVVLEEVRRRALDKFGLSVSGCAYTSSSVVGCFATDRY